MKKIILIIFASGLSGCSVHTYHNADMLNPASLHCIKQHGKLDIFKESGGEVGYCILPSGKRIEEWALFRRDSSE